MFPILDSSTLDSSIRLTFQLAQYTTKRLNK